MRLFSALRPGDRHGAADAATEGRSDGGLKAFLATEVGGTCVLLAAAIAGLAWANSPWSDSYEALWHTELSIRLGAYELVLDLKEWVNDGLMTLFFFVVGLEVSREVRVGQLRERRLVMVPICAAIAGMVFPALIYIAINAGGPGAAGWGVPMATDTAFVVGLLALLGARCAGPLRAYLLTLAVSTISGRWRWSPCSTPMIFPYPASLPRLCCSA